MKESAGKLSNGMEIASVDDETLEIMVIVPVGWTVMLVTSNSGATFADRPSGPFSKVFKCEQTRPAPRLVKP